MKNKKNIQLTILLMVITLSLVSHFVSAHGADPSKPVHQYLTNESQYVWKLIPFEIKKHLLNNISKELYLPNEICISGYCAFYDGRKEGCYDSGDDIITGSAEEDYCKRDGALGNDKPISPALWRNHYWNPDDPDFSQYDTGLLLSEGSFIHSTVLWEDTIDLYLKGEINRSYYYLGRVAHLLQDASVPAHMHNDKHWPDRDEYEYFIADINNTFPNTQNKPNFYHWKGENYQNQYYKYENLTYLTEEQWSDINKRLNEVSYPSNLFKLFWYTAQKTQYFASDNNDGNDYYRKWWQITGTNTFSPSLWQSTEANITSDSSLIEDASTCNSTGKCPNLRNISNALIPHSMKATAGLYELFYDTANSYHWPTFHHDNRRTGFTLLKGDMTQESKVAKINLVLQGDVTPDSIARPSIADVDGNGNMETVVATARNANEGYIYAIETKKTLLTPITKRLKTEEKWHINIGKNILVTPTIANIDSDSVKEVVFGLDNGSLYAIDVSSSGDSASIKWVYTVSEKAGYTGELGNTAVADIDNDGVNEIIIMDGMHGFPSWTGEVYVLRDNGNSATLEAKYNISNGGGWGAASLANVDSDDNMEIIVPSYYGVYVFDYNGSALSEKCSTNHGKLFNSVVVYDVDKDNKYELIYTTSTKGCTAPMTCYDKLYILDAETCNDESGWPKTISYYSRTTPAIANLDSDSNLEIAIFARDSTSGYDSRILCYDANTGNEDCNYNDGGNLEAYEISPDIFDVDGDGYYNIIIPDKNYELHILDGDGTQLYAVTLDGIIGSAPAVGDLDNDGVAEIAVKRAGSPISVITTMTDFNNQPSLTQINNITAIAGDLININATGEISAYDNDALTYYFSSPFNSSGLWKSTINDTGNYSILIEASDGNLSDSKLINLMVFNYTTKLEDEFADGTNEKSLSFSGKQNQTVRIRIPKNATILYTRMKITGGQS